MELSTMQCDPFHPTMVSSPCDSVVYSETTKASKFKSTSSTKHMETTYSSTNIESSRGIPIVNGRFLIIAKLGAGSFGEVYVVSETATGKLGTVKLQRLNKFSQLYREYVVYRELHRVFYNHVAGFAQVLYYGIEGDYELLVMELLGPTLEELFQHCNRRLSRETVLTIGEQLLHTLEHIHTLGFLHRDIKPSNCTMGLAKYSHNVYLIDFGLCSRYVTSSGQHIAMREDRPFVGTTRFCSINIHLGLEPTRRDDMESLAYVLIYLFVGSLPWQSLKAHTKEMMRQLVMESKMRDIDPLLPHLPRSLADFVAYVRLLGFSEAPDYQRWREAFRDEIQKPFEETTYDWEAQTQCK